MENKYFIYRAIFFKQSHRIFKRVPYSKTGKIGLDRKMDVEHVRKMLEILDGIK